MPSTTSWSASTPWGRKGEARLGRLVDTIKRSGRGKAYDCVVGLSGGTDSTYLLYLAVQLGLRPLAVHFDNGWNSEIAVRNIEKATSRLGVDLETHVVQWEAFRSLQISFLKASVSDAEIPTDMAIHAVLHDYAAREGLKHILIGHSFRAEGVVPKEWTYFEDRYIRQVHRLFSGSSRLPVPVLGPWKLFEYMLLRGIKVAPLLNHVDYSKEAAAKVLAEELGWEYYGGHHHESLYTKFFQSYLLPRKFGIDKRKLSLSARIRSGKLDRERALATLASEDYPFDPEMLEYALEKLEMTPEQFEAIMRAEPKSFRDYPTYFPLMTALRGPLTLGFRLGLVPSILYYKYVY